MAEPIVPVVDGTTAKKDQEVKGAAIPVVGVPVKKLEDEGFFASPLFQTLLKMATIYVVITFLTGPNSPFRTKPSPVTFVPPTDGNGGLLDTAAGVNVAPVPAFSVVNLWAPGTLLDISLHLSTSPTGFVDFSDTSLPSTTWKGIEYSNTKWSEAFETEFDVPHSVQHNASLWVDIFVTQSGVSPDSRDATYVGEREMSHTRKLLTRHLPQRKVRAVKNLFAAKEVVNETLPVITSIPEVEEILPIISYYHPNLTLQLVMVPDVLVYSSLPDPIKNHLIIAHEDELNPEGNGYVFPPVWPNDFWLMNESMNPINSTTTKLPLRITLTPTSYMKFQIFATLDDSFTKQASAAGGGSGGDFDELKRMLTETNPILLITTVIVTILHLLFEMLAFTSDITHWRSKKELVGVSVRTIITNCVVQLVVLLYLLDNNEKTSWMILFSQGTGLAIEGWKITKAVDIAVVPSVGTLMPYKLLITDKHVLSEEELKTQEYDKLAFRWVTYGTVPALIGFTIYSMIYNEHRGWYSFVISTLTSFVYMFGFVQLIPLLIINYKLKSVAHLPMKTLTYKFFATIVDDFFSFVIKMPLLHRLACFRDDVVFLVLLYQMWIYKVDHSRINEYGQKLTDEEAARLKAENEAKASGIKIESKKDI